MGLKLYLSDNEVMKLYLQFNYIFNLKKIKSVELVNLLCCPSYQIIE